jgi:predicted SAM-dependent methyltransferase
MKLNLGCGWNKLDGYINLDRNSQWEPDVVAELPEIPFPDETFTHIVAWHIIEHLPDKISLFNECWRVLEPGGELHILTPYAFSHAAHQDPTHVTFWVPESFAYYTSEMDFNYGIKIWSSRTSHIKPNGWEVEAFLYK